MDRWVRAGDHFLESFVRSKMFIPSVSPWQFIRPSLCSAHVTSLQYFEYTLAALKEHVYAILNDCEQLTMRAQSYDLNQHPRVPVIVAHNQLVFNTFTMTAALLEQMG